MVHCDRHHSSSTLSHLNRERERESDICTKYKQVKDIPTRDDDWKILLV